MNETVCIKRLPRGDGTLPPMPAYQTEGAAAMYLHAFLEAPVTLEPMERRAVPTGLCLEMPAALAAFVLARSGLSTKKGLALANGVGLIDPDYRGELLCSVINLSAEPLTICDGDRIAQLLFQPFCRPALAEQDTLSETRRGSGGFGSTGKR